MRGGGVGMLEKGGKRMEEDSFSGWETTEFGLLLVGKHHSPTPSPWEKLEILKKN